MTPLWFTWCPSVDWWGYKIEIGENEIVNPSFWESEREKAKEERDLKNYITERGDDNDNDDKHHDD